MKAAIEQHLTEAEKAIRQNLPGREEYIDIRKYQNLVHDGIWTQAFRKALQENSAVYLPGQDAPYLLDDTVVIPSNRHILAEEAAVIRLTEETNVLMFRNEHTVDGTHLPETEQNVERDHDISIIGGRYEEPRSCRAGYGKTGMYDKDRSYYGVSTCMFFDHVDDLVIQDAVFIHAAGFCVQTGDLKRAIFGNIVFEECFADGLHLNGNSEDLIIRNIRGQVGDDLVALNMYDWQNSSVNFGPIRNVLCDQLDLAVNSLYKAMRIEPGTYYYDNGSSVDCGLYNAVIKHVRGINTFKMYYQTPPYRIGEAPERGNIGSADEIYFEDITVDLNKPIDDLKEYTESDPVRGTFAAFEFGSAIGTVSLEQIHLTLHREQYPCSYLACVGPKSCREGEKEIFDPYLSSSVKLLKLDRIEINGDTVTDPKAFLHEICFDDVNHDGHSTAEGRFEHILFE